MEKRTGNNEAVKLLVAKNIFKKFGDKEVLKGVDLTVDKGEVVAFIGKSGSGKSTFLRCLNQLETIDKGTVTIDGIQMFGEENGKYRYAAAPVLRDITKRMGMVFQSFNLFPHMSVLQNLVDPQVRVLKVKKDAAIEQAREMLKKVGLSENEKQYPYQLSGGQAQRVAIARALCMKPEIMCFDEPTSALDPLLTKEVLAVMRELASEHMTMIVVTHEMDFARDVADRVVFMKDGVIVEDSPAHQLFASTNPDTREFLGLPQ